MYVSPFVYRTLLFCLPCRLQLFLQVDKEPLPSVVSSLSFGDVRRRFRIRDLISCLPICFLVGQTGSPKSTSLLPQVPSPQVPAPPSPRSPPPLPHISLLEVNNCVHDRLACAQPVTTGVGSGCLYQHNDCGYFQHPFSDHLRHNPVLRLNVTSGAASVPGCEKCASDE